MRWLARASKGILSLILPAVLLAALALSLSTAGLASASPGLTPHGPIRLEDSDSKPALTEIKSTFDLTCVIITNDEFSPILQKMADWKTKKGVPTAVYTTSWIYANYLGDDHPEKIKGFISDIYERQGVRPVKYIILAGDVDIVPTRKARGYSCGAYWVYTDYYYADLSDWDTDGDQIYAEIADDNADFFAELSVGRLPASNREMMQGLVDKIINYEKDPPQGDWYKRALFLGAITNHPEDRNGSDCEEGQEVFFPKEDRGKLMDYIVQHILPPHFSAITLYEKEGINSSDSPCTCPLNESNVLECFRSGCSLITSASHADETRVYRIVWNEDRDKDGLLDTKESSDSKEDIPPYLTQETFLDMGDVDLLKNDGKLPLAYFGGCKTNNFNHSSDCLGEKLMKNQNGGVIGFVGATGTHWASRGWPAYIDFSQDLQRKFWKEFFNENTGNYRAGPALSYAKTAYIDSRENYCITDPYEGDRALMMEYCLLGDPELPIWTDVPENFIVSYSPEIFVGAPQEVTVVVENSTGGPVESARVCLQKSSVYVYGYTDSSGEITFSVNPSTAGCMDVTTTKHNYLPSESIIDVKSIENMSAENAAESLTSLDPEVAAETMGNLNSEKAGDIIDAGVEAELTDEIASIFSKMDIYKAASAVISAESNSSARILESITWENVDAAALITDNIAKRNLEKAASIADDMEIESLAGLLIKIYELPHTPEVVASLLGAISLEKSTAVIQTLIEQGASGYIDGIFKHLTEERLNDTYGELTTSQRGALYPNLSSEVIDGISAGLLPRFDARNLAISPTEVELGETTTISVGVMNTGGTPGTHTVELSIKGEVINSEDVTLIPDETKTVSFAVTEEEEGTYNVAVNGLTGSFEVKKPAAFPWPIVVAIIIIVILMVAICYWKREEISRKLRRV